MVEKIQTVESDLVDRLLENTKNELIQEKIAMLALATSTPDELRKKIHDIKKPHASAISILEHKEHVLERAQVILTLFEKTKDKIITTLADRNSAYTFEEKYAYFFKQLSSNLSRTDILCKKMGIKRSDTLYPNINNLFNDIIGSYEKIESNVEENDIEAIRDLHILNEYLIHYITEMDIRIGEYLINKSLEEATHPDQLATIEQYEKIYKKYTAQQSKLATDIVTIQESILRMPNIFENATDEVKNELDKEQGKGKIRRLLDILLGRDETITIKPSNKVPTEQQEILKRYQVLLEMHQEYGQHLAKHSVEEVSTFISKVQQKKEKLLIDGERDAMNRLGENILNEALVVGGKKLEGTAKEAFLNDFFVRYKKITKGAMLTDQEKNVTPLDRFFGGIKHAPQLLSLLIRHNVFDSTADIARSMGVYNGKKMLHMSLKSVKVSTSARMNVLISPGVSIDMEHELQNTLLFGLDTNSKEAILAIIFRQSRVIGKYGAALTNGLVNMTTSIMSVGLKDGRGEIGNALHGLKGLKRNMANEHSRFYELLSVVGEQLGQSNIAELDHIMGPQGTMSKYIDDVFMHIQGSGLLVAWEQSLTNTTIESAEEATKSLQAFLQRKGIPLDEKRTKRLQDFSDAMKGYTDRQTPHGRKKQIGLFISQSIAEKQSGLVDSLKNHNKIKTFLGDRGLYTFLRNSVSNIINTTSDIALIFKQHFTLQSYRGVGRIWTLTGGAVINNARFFSWVNELTQQSKQGFVKFGSAADIKEFNAMMQTGLKYFPQFIGNIVRSSPIAFMIQAKSSEETQLELGKLAGMLIPIIGPCLIIDDALGSQGIKFGELALGTFFLGLEIGVIGRATLKYGGPFSSRGAVAGGMKAVELLFDPFIATKNMVVSPLHTAQTGTNIASNAAKIAKESGALQTALARVGMVSAVVGVSIFGIKKGLDYSHFEKVRSYIEIRSGKRKYEGKSGEAGAKEFLAQYREEMPIGNKEQILQRELTYYAQELYHATPVQTHDGTYRSNKPSLFRTSIDHSGMIMVELASTEMLGREEYGAFSSGAKEHILSLLPENSSIRFKNDLKSFYYGRIAFELTLQQFLSDKFDVVDDQEAYLVELDRSYQNNESIKNAFDNDFIAFVYDSIQKKDGARYEQERIKTRINHNMPAILRDRKKVQ